MSTNALKTHCKRGHSFSRAYIYTRRDGTVTRNCPTCRAHALKRWREKNPEGYQRSREKQMPTVEQAKRLIAGFKKGLTLKQMTVGRKSPVKRNRKGVILFRRKHHSKQPLKRWYVCSGDAVRNYRRVNKAFDALCIRYQRGTNKPKPEAEHKRQLSPWFKRALMAAAGDDPAKYAVLYRAVRARKLRYRDLKKLTPRQLTTKLNFLYLCASF